MRANPGIEQVQRTRLIFVGFALTIFAALIAQRLYWYQIADHPRFAALASEEHEQRRPIIPRRGTLLDTNGHPLALSVMYDAVFVHKTDMTNIDRTASFLAEALGMPKEEVLSRIQGSDRSWTLLSPRVAANAAARIEAERLPGVELQRIPAREYPEGSVAAQILGFTGVEGRGLSGVELTFDQELAGRAGVLLSERDTTGGEITIARKALIAEVPGADIVLTIDRYIQRVAERELTRAVHANKATGGLIIVMEPSSGRILAAATSPTYNQGSGFDPARPELYRPSIATDTYEPGSVMKLITAAAALEESIVNPNTRYFDSGVALVNGVPIRNWDGGAYGSVTLRDILVYSLNTGMQWVASQLGPERFYEYVQAFGFGEPTGIRLNGEAGGNFRRPSDAGWSRIDLATNSYGQSISVTPLQMITAVAALGNGGVLMRPQIVREIRDAERSVAVEPEPLRAVVSPRTAEMMLDMMVSAWTQPALAANRIEGYTLAAKSGTADIPAAGGYSSGKTYASYIGFGPIPNPRFVVLVRLDRPEAIYGGTVAAPVFRNVAMELLTYLQVPPRPSR